MTGASVDPLDRIVAVEEIKKLKARYFRCIDTKDFAGLLDVFAADATSEEVGTPGVIEGNEAISSSIGQWLRTVQTVHHGFLPEIDIDDRTWARGIWAFEDRLWGWPPGESAGALHGYGHYHETYTRTDEGWRIATMRIERIRVDVALVGTTSVVGISLPPL